MADHPRFKTMLKRGILRRCPVCGRGRIFRSLLRLRRSCPACGWVVEREPGTVTGAMYLIAILTQLFAGGLFFLLWIGTDWEPALKLALGLPLIVFFSIAALPVSKGIWVAVEYATDVATGETQRAGYDAQAFENRDRRGDAVEKTPQ